MSCNCFNEIEKIAINTTGFIKTEKHMLPIIISNLYLFFYIKEFIA